MAYINKLPDHDKKAKLTDLTMENENIHSMRDAKDIVDLESS